MRPYAGSFCSRPCWVQQLLVWILVPHISTTILSSLPVAESDLTQPVGNHDDVLKFANMMRVNLSFSINSVCLDFCQNLITSWMLWHFTMSQLSSIWLRATSLHHDRCCWLFVTMGKWELGLATAFESELARNPVFSGAAIMLFNLIMLFHLSSRMTQHGLTLVALGLCQHSALLLGLVLTLVVLIWCKALNQWPCDC